MRSTVVATALVHVLLAGTCAAAEPCLTGTARLLDARDLGALRSEIERSCPCAAFQGAPGADRSSYRRCAGAVRDGAVRAGSLRSACRRAATREYFATTCGTDDRVVCARLQPGSAKHPTSCRIKRALRCRTRSTREEYVCAGDTRCSDALDPTAGDCLPGHETAYAASWSAVHADASNSDFSPVAGAIDLTLKWQVQLDGSINLGPTIDPGGRVYVTDNFNDAGCHLTVLDGRTGEVIWCSAEVDRFAVASSPLLDRDGRIFLADGTAMRAFAPDGRVIWRTPIVGVPLSAQFTPSGRVIFITHVGVVYVLARETGEPMLPPIELIPGASWTPAQSLNACLQGTAGCPSANTLAVDQATGRLFFTFWDTGAPQAGLRAMQYTERPAPHVAPLWTNDALPGGSASSPDVSADGTRVYVNDNVDSVHAIDAATGATIWSFRIGFAPGGSPSTSPAGLIMPSGSRSGVVMAVADRGASAELLWRNDGMINRGIPTQASGGLSYATVSAGGFANDLVVIDTATGAELDREHLPGSTIFTVGTTVGGDGTVFVPTFAGQLFAFGRAGAAP